MEETKKCPVCYGTGFLNKRPSFIDELFRLKKEGLSFAQISRVLGFASPNTSFYHYKRWKDKKNEPNN